MATRTQKVLIAADTLADVNAAITEVNDVLSTSLPAVTASRDPDILNDRQREALANAVKALATQVDTMIGQLTTLISEVGAGTAALDAAVLALQTVDATHTSDIDALETDVTALQVMTTAGDIIVGGASGVYTRLAKGTDGQVLKMVAGAVAWAADAIE